MSDDQKTIRDAILRLLDEQGHADLEAPQSYAVGNIENAAIGVFENRGKLVAWMRGVGLDPYKGPDAVAGLGLLLMLDREHGRRLEPVVDEDFEWPDEH